MEVKVTVTICNDNFFPVYFLTLVATVLVFWPFYRFLALYLIVARCYCVNRCYGYSAKLGIE